MNMTQEFAKVTQFPAGSPFVEAFGLLMASLVLQNGSGPARTVAVVGARAGDGASTTALNLALTSARTGRRTLLVDADVRTPSLHATFAAAPSPGVAEVLSGSIQLEAAVQVTTIPQLSLLSAGNLVGSPLSILHPRDLTRVMDEVRASYEFAVFDLPPILAFSEALHVARHTDGVVVVLAEDAPRRLEVEVRRRLERVDAKIRGIVLNRSEVREEAFRA